MALIKLNTGGIDNSVNLGRRNMIINGATQVAQRGTSATGKTQSGYYCSDRFQVYFNNLGEMTATVSQDSNAPDGFSNSHKVLITTPEAASYSTTELHCGAWYKFEGQDLQHLQYGTSGAKDLTLSFWVKSNVTGTYTASFYKTTGGSKVVVPTYTINTADTWEYKTVTVSGDTAVAFANNTSNELDIYFNTAVGPGYTSGSAATTWSSYITTNWAVGHTAQFGLSANDYWQITGVQLELGKVATPFEHRSYGEELALCQRYCYVIGDPSQVIYLGTGSMYTTTAVNLSVPLPVQLRTTSPSFTPVANGTGNWLNVYVGATGTVSNATPLQGDYTQSNLRIYITGAHSGSSPSAAGAGVWSMVLAGAQLIINAEL